MPDILVGQTIKAVDRPAATYKRDPTTQANQSNTTFQTGSPVVDVTFTAPTSGRVLLVLGTGARDNAGSGNHARVSAEIYEGADATGTLVFSPAHARSVTPMDSATDYQHVSAAYMVTALTPGATHYARVMHEVSGGTSIDITVRDIGIIPVT